METKVYLITENELSDVIGTIHYTALEVYRTKRAAENRIKQLKENTKSAGVSYGYECILMYNE